MAPSKDPLGHYRVLGLSAAASAADIKSAYRRQAKRLHPDRNPSPEAARAFHRLTEAYRVLSSPADRARYDAGELQPSTAAPTRAGGDATGVPCGICGAISAQPRYVIFWRVIANGWRARMVAIEGVMCPRCAPWQGFVASLWTWMLGWWAPLGPFRSVRALRNNLRGGDLPSDRNAVLLLKQARAFLARGQPVVAKAVAEQAVDFAREGGQRGEAERMLDGLRHLPGRTLKRRWPISPRARLAQATPILLLLSSIGVAVAIDVLASDPVLARLRSGGTIADQSIEERRHDVVLRQSPGVGAAPVGVLTPGEILTVRDFASDGMWVLVTTESGRVGYVSLLDLRYHGVRGAASQGSRPAQK